MMTGAEFRIWREYLGLTHPALASELGKDERTLRRWESGQWAVPAEDAARTQHLVDTLQDEADVMLADLEQAIEAGHTPTIRLWSTKERCAADHVGRPPRYAEPGYHRALAAQALANLPADSATVVYVDVESTSPIGD